MLKKVALIDGDHLLYRAAAAIQHKGYIITTPTKKYDLKDRYTLTEIKKALGVKLLEYNEYPIVESHRNACASFKRTIAAILRHLDTDKYFVFLESLDKTNFRYVIAKTATTKGLGYKFGRPPKPEAFMTVYHYICDRHPTYIVEGMETDDAICSAKLPTSLDKEEWELIMCHQDKDLKSKEGKHFDYVLREEYEVHGFGGLELIETVSNSGAKTKKIKGNGLIWFYAQVLLGDSATDNIPGIPGYGAVGVYKTLAQCKTEEDCLQTVLSIYIEKFGEKEGYLRFFEIVDLIWMMQDRTYKSQKLLVDFPDFFIGAHVEFSRPVFKGAIRAPTMSERGVA